MLTHRKPPSVPSTLYTATAAATADNSSDAATLRQLVERYGAVRVINAVHDLQVAEREPEVRWEKVKHARKRIAEHGYSEAEFDVAFDRMAKGAA